MAQTVPFSAYLGPVRTGQAIGYTVYAMDGATVVSAFTTTNVVERPAGSGDFHVNGGVSVPDAGGYIAVGTSGNEIKRVGVDPASSINSETITDALDQYDVATSADIAALATTHTVTVISAVVGNEIKFYRGDTWAFTMTLPFSLDSYEAVALVVKEGEKTEDSAAALYLRSDTGLRAIAGAAATDSSKGTLEVDGTELTINVQMSETVKVTDKDYTWWLKVFDATTTPDEGYTRATGPWKVEPYGLRAIA